MLSKSNDSAAATVVTGTLLLLILLLFGSIVEVEELSLNNKDEVVALFCGDGEDAAVDVKGEEAFRYKSRL